ncbi:ADP-ribosylation factor-like protein 4D [Petromyzon marinus]|uniref:ADP-ribosylation factor-like protein 4D n=1 Tax=Petromyzon marinus TaxID=7757 RepID=UPI003F70F5B1
MTLGAGGAPRAERAEQEPGEARGEEHPARGHPAKARGYPAKARGYPAKARGHPAKARGGPRTQPKLPGGSRLLLPDAAHPGAVMGNSLSGEGGTASSALPSLGLGAPLHVTLLGLDSAGKTALLYRLKLGEFLHTTPTVSFNTERLRLPVAEPSLLQAAAAAPAALPAEAPPDEVNETNGIDSSAGSYETCTSTVEAGGDPGLISGPAASTEASSSDDEEERDAGAEPSDGACRVAQHAPGLAVSFHFWDVGGQEKLRPLWRSYVRGADGLVFVADASDPERLEEARCELLRVSRLPECQGVPVLVAASKSDLPGALPADEVGRRVGATQLSPHTAWRAQAVSARTGAGVAEALHQLHEVIVEGRRLARMHKRKRPR